MSVVMDHLNNIWKDVPIDLELAKKLDDDFTIQEVDKAINQLPNDKACGSDGIPAEVYKLLKSNELLEVLCDFNNKCKE